MAYIFANKSDHKKYGSVIHKWASEITPESNRYPKTLEEVVDVFTIHPFDNVLEKKVVQRAMQRTWATTREKDDDSRWTETTAAPTTASEASFAQCHRAMTLCFRCGSPDHLAND